MITNRVPDKYAAFCKLNKLPKFRYEQICKGVYHDLIENYEELTTLEKALRAQLAKDVPLRTLKLTKEITSKDWSTTKQLLATSDGHLIEAVLMRHEDGRNTICVSCMSGCPVGCVFCATGRMGFQENLTADEIVEQVLRFARILKLENKKVTNVVFMGMGEPMLNLSAVKEGITILTDPNKLGLGQRRITVSTSGYLPQLTEFIQAGFRGRLAISLHAPTQELREELMPTVAKVFPLDKLLEKLDEFTTLTNKRISYEYILIKEVNDKFEHAGELVRLFRDRLAHINLIPYNAIADSEFVTPERERVLKFRDILADAGIPVTVRVSMGADVAGACGQLTDVQPAEFANLV